MVTFSFAESQAESGLQSSKLFPLLHYLPNGRTRLIWTIYPCLHPKKCVAQFPAWILEPYKWVTSTEDIWKSLLVTLKGPNADHVSVVDTKFRRKRFRTKIPCLWNKIDFLLAKKDCEVLEGEQNCFIIWQIHKTYTTNIIQNYNLMTDSVIQ